VAALPSLQRDAVWKPGQVELLWDSLFRGFPIGSVVVSEELKGQKSRSGKIAGKEDPWPDTNMIKRHLLDGQQRSNAIALGYFDPFPCEESVMPVGTAGNILWLDLFPDQEAFKSGSTRHYLFRVTTSAHPWGYSYADNAGPLNAHDMREMRDKRDLGKEEEGKSPQQPQDDKYQRPSVLELWPAKASILTR
jgi:hypothetical protein